MHLLLANNSASAGGALPPAFESIATVVADGGSATSIQFNSIPQTYASLQIRGYMRGFADISTTNMNVRINGLTSANYAWHRINGNGSVVVVSGSTGNTSMRLGDGWGQATSNETSVIIIDIHDYANDARTKTFRAFGGRDTQTNSNGMVFLTSGFWHQTTAPITSITLIPTDGQFIPNQSSFALYGIKAA